MGEELHWTGDSCLCWRSKQEVQLGRTHFLVHEEDLRCGRTVFLFIYWLHWVLVVAHGIFSCSMWDLPSSLGSDAQSRLTLCHPSWTVAHQAPLWMGFSRQEYRSGLPLPTLGSSPLSRDQTCVPCIGSPESQSVELPPGKSRRCVLLPGGSRGSWSPSELPPV